MSSEIEKAIEERDDEWREAIVPGGRGISWGLVKKPADAYLWLQSRSETEYECVIYFEKRATKARLRRREAEHNLYVVAQEWEMMKNAHSDPKFSKPVEALLTAALAKKRNKE